MGVSQWAETHGALPHLLVLGAGPVGLETAVAALSQGWRVTVLERGAQPGQNVRDWGHVNLFSSWELNTTNRLFSEQLRVPAGWRIISGTADASVLCYGGPDEPRGCNDGLQWWQ